MLMYAQQQPRQSLLQLLQPPSRVPSALPTMPANALVALAEVLGSGNVGISATQTSITLGERAWKSAKASSWLVEKEVNNSVC